MAANNGEKAAPESSPKGFDDILAIVGPFGRYQKLTMFLVLLPAIIPSGFLSMSSVFLAATPADFWCTNDTRKLAQTGVADSVQRKEKSCVMAGSLFDSEDLNRTSHNDSGVSFATCQNGWEFDDSAYKETIVTEWELVCSRKWEAAFSFTVFTLGGVAGPLIWGTLADRIGRKKAFFLCAAFQSVFAIATAFSPSYIWFCIFRFCVGMTASAGYTIPFVLTLEINGPKSRAFAAVLCSTCYTLGCLVFLAIAYWIRYWRALALVSSVSVTVLYFVLFWFFPESPRWLLSRGLYDELDVFLRRIARTNRRSVLPSFRDSLPQILRKIDKEDHTKKHSVLDLFRSPNMRKKTLILVFLNMCNKGVSLGLNYYLPQYSANPHWIAFLNTIVELIPYFVAKFAFDRLGRRLSVFLGLFTGAASCLVTLAIPTSVPDVVLGLSLVVKLAITFTYLSGKLIEDEIFPTVVRSEGHSLVSVLSSGMTCGVPFVVQLGDDYKILPLLVFGVLCFVAASLVIFLPETAHQRVPQTLEDGENFGKNMRCQDLFSLRLKRPENIPAVITDEEEGEMLTPTNGYPDLVHANVKTLR